MRLVSRIFATQFVENNNNWMKYLFKMLYNITKHDEKGRMERSVELKM